MKSDQKRIACKVSVVAFVAVTLTFCLSPSPCHGILVAQHEGNSDPASEGWTVLSSGVTPVAEGPVSNDFGLDAWNMENLPGNGFKLYEQEVPVAQRLLGDTNGWTLRANLRVIAGEETPGGGIWLEYSTIFRRFIMAIGHQPDGDPVVRLPSTSSAGVFEGLSFAIEGIGSGYHLYELVYDPQTTTADLLVDGVEVVSDYAGTAGIRDSVFWGVGTPTTGNANYNLVELVVVPEPSGLSIGVVPTIVLFASRKNNRRNHER